MTALSRARQRIEKMASDCPHEIARVLRIIKEEAEQERPLDAPFVVRQFEGRPWVPLHEAARLHDAHQAAELRVAALRNELSALSRARKP